MSHVRQTTPWGTGVSTGAGSIDIVLLDATMPMTIPEIEAEVRRRKLPERGAVYEHLASLKRRGHVVDTSEGWCRVELAGKPSKNALAPKIPATAPKTPPSSPNPPTAPDDRTERLQRLKLILEIGVVAVSLIGGVIALIWGTQK